MKKHWRNQGDLCTQTLQLSSFLKVEYWSNIFLKDVYICKKKKKSISSLQSQSSDLPQLVICCSPLRATLKGFQLCNTSCELIARSICYWTCPVRHGLLIRVWVDTRLASMFICHWSPSDLYPTMPWASWALTLITCSCTIATYRSNQDY